MNDVSSNLEAGVLRIPLLGTTVTPMTTGQLIHTVASAAKGQSQIVIGHHNIRSISICQHDRAARDFFARADYTFIDGMPLIVHANLLGFPLTRDQRITSVDWLPPLLDECRRQGWKVAFVGGTPHVAETARRILKRDFPGLQLTSHHGYFDLTPGEADSEAVITYVNAHEPHLLLVGMGMPRQEQWILRNIDRIDANVSITIGAGMDYVAGVIPTPPRWMGRIGLEWLYRLLCEPRRLGRRYLIEPWSVTSLFLRDYSVRIFELLFRRSQKEI